ncbi:MAG: hypothetical protein WBP79_11610 [Candidatus Acidiferrales bacterium]
MVPRVARGPFKGQIRVRFPIARPILGLVFLFAAHSALAQESQTIPSPDDSLRAEIQTVHKSVGGAAESKIEILSREGKKVWAVKYTSRDGEHGFGVVKAAWTADSQYFVYSLSSSGAHPAGRSPTFFYDRKADRVRSFDAEVDNVTDADFTLSAPDIVEALVSNNGKPKRVRVALSALRSQRSKS